MCQFKNFENWTIIGEDMDRVRVRATVYINICIKLFTETVVIKNNFDDDSVFFFC